MGLSASIRVRLPTTLSDRATPILHVLLIGDLEVPKVNADVSSLSHRVIGEVDLGSMEDHTQPDPVRGLGALYNGRSLHSKEKGTVATLSLSPHIRLYPME